MKPQTPLVNQYISDRGASSHSTAWWKALDRQLVHSLDEPVDELDVSVLQNVIYFANVHPDEMQLDGASARLMDIYEEHPRKQFRLMALVALHALNAREEVRAIYEDTRADGTERLIQRVATAAVSEY